MAIVVVACVGCGATRLNEGRDYLERKDYIRALEALTDALNTQPNNPQIHRDLGMAYYGARQYQQAQSELVKARESLPRDSRTIFYLGLTYERLEQYDKAVEAYSDYVNLSRFSVFRRAMQERVTFLTRLAANQWAQQRLQDERNIEVSAIPTNSLAVTYFQPFGVSEKLVPLHKGLTDLLIVDLALIEGLTVVERIKLKEIYDELALASTQLVAGDTALRMGKLLGANTLVTGAFTGLGDTVDSQWRVDPTLGRSASSEIETLPGIEGNLANFIQVEKQLALQILDSLDIPLTPEVRASIEAKIRENVPTTSLEAFLAYSRGLDYQDLGIYERAESEFSLAVSIDPGFGMAKRELETTRILSQAVPGAPPLTPLESLETEWSEALNQSELADEALFTTVDTVSRIAVGGAEATAPRGNDPETPEAVEVEVQIRW